MISKRLHNWIVLLTVHNEKDCLRENATKNPTLFVTNSRHMPESKYLKSLFPSIRAEKFFMGVTLHSCRVLLLFVLLLVIQPGTWGQTVSFTDNTPGTRNFTVPAGVTSVTIECWGAGGGGGGSNNNNNGGSGGGGGGYTTRTLTGLTPGSTISYTVGLRGTAGVANGGTGGTGGATTCSGMTANGGTGGVGNRGAAGTGGTAAGGTINVTGNNGVQGTTQGGNGGDGANGGAGGEGETDGAGQPGNAPGGGGGGGEDYTFWWSTDYAGGAGAPGQVTFSWIPAYRARFDAMNYGTSEWYSGETRTVTVTVTNTGSAAWTDASPDINIGIKWNTEADYYVRVDAGNLIPGATHTYALTITAPLTTGTYNLSFDVVNEVNCWFGDNDGSCGPGNSVYTSPIITVSNVENPGTIISTTSSYTVPPNVFFLDVACWGGGGKGGARTTGNIVPLAGGGGGAYSRSIVSVTPGNTYTVSVGTGSSTIAAGGDSWFGSNTTVMAKGGNSVANNSNTPGPGGLASAGYGNDRYNGGNGATGTGGSFGGGGGSSAGTSAAGNYINSTTNTRNGATAPTGGGNGGLGAQAGTPGFNGTSPGGGGGGGYRAGNGTTQNPGNGANGQVKIILPASVTLASPSQIPAGAIYQGITSQPLFSFNTAIATSHALINTVTFTSSGTYQETDINKFQLWYSTENDFSTATQAGADIITSLGTGSHTFININKKTFAGTTGYFWITADLANNASPGATLSIDAFASLNCTSGNLTYQMACISGSTTAGGLQTIHATPEVVLSSDNPAVPAASVAQGTSDQAIYAFRAAVTNADATLTSVSFYTDGTCTVGDLENFKLWYNTTPDFATSFNIGDPIISSLGSGTHTFTGFSQTISSGTTGYFWITTGISSLPADGHTVTVSAITTSNLTFINAIKSGTTYAGGTMTISLFNGILLGSTRPAVSANSILQSSVKQPIYKFTTIITGASATLSSLTFTTAGTYAASDVINLRLWYNSLNSLVGATQIGSTITTGTGTGSHTFGGLSQTINGGEKGYFWITADLSGGAVAGHTLYVPAITTASITYASGSKSGIAYDGGVQTIQENVDIDADGSPDLYELDDDNDGIPDLSENAPCNTSALELFPNTDFNAGNIGFSSAYEYAVPAGDHTLWDEGLYTIVNNPHSIHENFSACGDHTSGSGNMMVVNANPVPEKVIWRSGTVNVLANTDYTLSFWVASVTPTNPAQLIWNVNGENIGIQFNATSTTCQWVNAVALWNSGSNTTATFDIINLNTAEGGNDFALDDISCKYLINCDSDGDGIQDRLDLDSDNDGIYDVTEADGTDNNQDGIIDSYLTDNDHDGLADAVDDQDAGSGPGEVTSGTPLANPDTDTDGKPNIIDLDSDDDDCYDAYEAGFNDGDDDGLLGSSPVTVNSTTGVVTSASGYNTPANANGDGILDYVQRLPYITTQPVDRNICAPSSGTTFEVAATNTAGTYQWQVSTDGGGSWSDVNNGGVYSGANTAILDISSAVTLDYNGYHYRLLLYNDAYSCQPLISDAVMLGVYTGAPVAPGAITGNTTVCPSVNATYSIDAVPQTMYYTWEVPSGWTIQSGQNTTSIVVQSGPSGGNIRVRAVNACGNGPWNTPLAVAVASPTPTFTTTPSTPYCQGTEYTYTTQTGKSDYVWSFSGSQYVDYNIVSGGTTSDNTVTLTWMTTGSKTVTINYTSGGCQGATPASNTISVIANLIINSQPVDPSEMCAGLGSQTISITTTPAATGYQWEVSADNGASWTSLSNGAPYSNVTTSAMTITSPSIALNGYQYRCLATGTCGTATSNAATLTVNTVSISTQSTGAQTQCIGGVFTPISVTSAGSGLSYQWYSNTTTSTTGGTSLGSADGAQTDTYTPQATVAGTLYYYCVVTGTCGTATSLISGAFIVNTIPNISDKTSEAYSGVAFTVTPVDGTDVVPAGTTYSWPAPIVTGSLTGGTTETGSADISGTLDNPTSSAQTATYTVTPSANGCTGTDFTVTITVNAIPVISDMTATICSGQTFSVTPVDVTNGIVPSGTTYSWPAPTVTGGITGGLAGSGAAGISGTLTNPTSSVQTATYTVTPTVGSYDGADFTVTVTVNSLPVPALSGQQEVCTGAVMTYTTDSGGGISGYSWNVSNGTFTGGATNQIEVTWGTITGNYEDHTVNVNYTDNNGCEASSPTELTIRIHRAPVTGPQYHINNQWNE